jgi:hypothetical protein
MIAQKCIWVAGVARSGTSWIGQIFNSHPNVRYRFQPLFSYEFKGRLNEESTRVAFETFADELWQSDSEFLTQADKIASGEYPRFVKNKEPTTLVFKENRYLSLIEPMLRRMPSLSVVGVVRHPCAVIESWSRNEREFPRGSVLREQWRFGQCKNSGPQDYFGFYKWKEVANLFLDLEQQYPGRMQLIRYEEIANQPELTAEKMLESAEIELCDEVINFLADSQSHHSDSYYSVFKNTGQQQRWRESLDAHIIDEIYSDLQGTRLQQFLEPGVDTIPLNEHNAVQQ